MITAIREFGEERIKNIEKTRAELITERALFPKTSYGFARRDLGIALSGLYIEIWRALVR